MAFGNEEGKVEAATAVAAKKVDKDKKPGEPVKAVPAKAVPAKINKE